LDHSVCYDDVSNTQHDVLTLCVSDNNNINDNDQVSSNSNTSNISSSSSDDPVSASIVDDTSDSALKLDMELSNIPGDVNDLASTSKALDNVTNNHSNPDDDNSVHIIDTSLLNFITNMYDDARICVSNYDFFSSSFSKTLSISPTFEHLSNKSKSMFLNSVSSSINYSWSA